MSEEEREKIFQELWDLGSGFRFLFGGFSDIALDEGANKAAIDFIHRKIKETVKDPKVGFNFLCRSLSRCRELVRVFWS